MVETEETKFRSSMKYREAVKNACKMCPHATVTPLEVLPRSSPDPEQEAVILCMACVVPRTIPAARFGNVHIVPAPLLEECVLSPAPNQSQCSIAAAHDQMENIVEGLGTQSFPETLLQQPGVNLDPLKGPIVLPNQDQSL